ncbi:hypothetical protein D3C86_1327670 [compost metagenome]
MAHLGADHVAQRTTVATGGHEQDHHVLHCARQNRADQNPQHAGQIAHLRRQHRPDQRPRARDGREMVAEQDVAGRGHIVQPVVMAHRRGGPFRVQPHDLSGQIAGVEAVGDGVDAKRRHHDPDGADALALMQGDDGEGDGPQYGDGAKN